MKVTFEDREKIIQLYFKILEKKAVLAEYYEYEKLLLKYDYSKEQIWVNLKKEGFESWEQYQVTRNSKQNQLNKNKDWDVWVAGTLLSLAVALLVAGLTKK